MMMRSLNTLTQNDPYLSPSDKVVPVLVHVRKIAEGFKFIGRCGSAGVTSEFNGRVEAGELGGGGYVIR